MKEFTIVTHDRIQPLAAPNVREALHLAHQLDIERDWVVYLEGVMVGFVTRSTVNVLPDAVGLIDTPDHSYVLHRPGR